MKTPTVWYALNAQMDGVDPLDVTPNGRASYLVYIQRKQLEFYQLTAMVNASCDENQKMDKALGFIEDIMLPKDPEANLRDVMRKQASIKEEQDGYFQAFFDGHTVHLKRVDGHNIVKDL